jgi:hypothetical protein
MEARLAQALSGALSNENGQRIQAEKQLNVRPCLRPWR